MSAAVEQSRHKANMVAQGDWIFSTKRLAPESPGERNLSELEFVRIRFLSLSEKLEFVRIGICQNWNLSELEFVRIGICQNGTASDNTEIHAPPKKCKQKTESSAKAAGKTSRSLSGRRKQKTFFPNNLRWPRNGKNKL